MPTISSRFRVRSIESTKVRRDGQEVRLRNIVLVPEISPAPANAASLTMWQGIPAGSITLNNVESEVAKHLEIDKIFKVNFTAAD